LLDPRLCLTRKNLSYREMSSGSSTRKIHSQRVNNNVTLNNDQSNGAAQHRSFNTQQPLQQDQWGAHNIFSSPWFSQVKGNPALQQPLQPEQEEMFNQRLGQDLSRHGAGNAASSQPFQPATTASTILAMPVSNPRQPTRHSQTPTLRSRSSGSPSSAQPNPMSTPSIYPSYGVRRQFGIRQAPPQKGKRVNLNQQLELMEKLPLDMLRQYNKGPRESSNAMETLRMNLRQSEKMKENENKLMSWSQQDNLRKFEDAFKKYNAQQKGKQQQAGQ
jgi:hypothetical protein